MYILNMENVKDSYLLSNYKVISLKKNGNFLIVEKLYKLEHPAVVFYMPVCNLKTI